jgi:NTE family protein
MFSLGCEGAGDFAFVPESRGADVASALVSHLQPLHDVDRVLASLTDPEERAARQGGEAPRAGTRRSPLDSPVIGTAATDLVVPCAQAEPRPATPPPPPEPPAFALAFSGGGFRATLSALGVLRFVADAGFLPRVRYVSSVSGGSVGHGMFAFAYPQLEQRGFSADALDELVIGPAIARISRESMTRGLVEHIWKIIGRKTRTNLLADTLDDWFFKGRKLVDLSPNCRFIFNASNLTTGVRFGFERDVVGDWVMGRVATAETDLRLADAVAASAAFPGAFAPMVMRDLDLPCAQGRVARLLDGGAYDNMGLEPLDDLADACLIALNAGGTFHARFQGGVPLVRDLMRVNGLLYRQSTALRRRWMVERFRAWEQTPVGQPKPPNARLGVLFNLATTIDPAPEWSEGRPEHDERRIPLAELKTTFNRFSRETCAHLVYRGWWLAGASLSKFHPELMTQSLPEWRPLPA